MGNNKPSILVVGSMNMDLVLKISRVPQAGESLIGETYQHIPGGKGANQAVAAARLGAQVSFAGRVGVDANGIKLREQMEKEGINTTFLKDDDEHQTGLAVILLEETGQNRILVYPGANMAIEDEDIEQVFQRDYDAALLQLEIPQKIVIKTFSLAKKRNIPVILDAGPAQDFPLEEMQGLEILSPNETEAYALTGIQVDTIEEAEKAARILEKRSKARFIVIKMGSKGAVLYHNDNVQYFPAYNVQAVDTTAAGDAFTAAMGVEYIKHGDIAKAIQYANAVGALTVTRLGAQPSLPKSGEVDDFIKDSSISTC
jgi:ribokinase